MQEKFRKENGVGFVYLADEFYLQSGMLLPLVDHYDGYPQLENGIGMVRDFLDDFDRLLSRSPGSIIFKEPTFVTGTLFAPVLEECLKKLEAVFSVRTRAVAVVNRFLGKRVTVAGLLAGSDILRGIPAPSGDFLAVPYHCLSVSKNIFLDDMTLEELAAGLRRPVCHLEPGVEGLWSALTGECRVVYP